MPSCFAICLLCETCPGSLCFFHHIPFPFTPFIKFDIHKDTCAARLELIPIFKCWRISIFHGQSYETWSEGNEIMLPPIIKIDKQMKCILEDLAVSAKDKGYPFFFYNLIKDILSSFSSGILRSWRWLFDNASRNFRAISSQALIRAKFFQKFVVKGGIKPPQSGYTYVVSNKNYSPYSSQSEQTCGPEFLSGHGVQFLLIHASACSPHWPSIKSFRLSIWLVKNLSYRITQFSFSATIWLQLFPLLSFVNPHGLSNLFGFPLCRYCEREDSKSV